MKPVFWWIEVVNHNKGFINIQFLQKLMCLNSETCWDKIKFFSFVNKQFGALVVWAVYILSPVTSSMCKEYLIWGPHSPWILSNPVAPVALDHPTYLAPASQHQTIKSPKSHNLAIVKLHPYFSQGQELAIKSYKKLCLSWPRAGSNDCSRHMCRLICHRVSPSIVQARAVRRAHQTGGDNHVTHNNSSYLLH